MEDIDFEQELKTLNEKLALTNVSKPKPKPLVTGMPEGASPELPALPQDIPKRPVVRGQSKLPKAKNLQIQSHDKNLRSRGKVPDQDQVQPQTLEYSKNLQRKYITAQRHASKKKTPKDY